MAQILALSGSARPGSYTSAVLQALCLPIAEWGHELRTLDLQELNLPIYYAPIEKAGMPEGVLTLQDAIHQADALLVGTPEYNGFPSPLLLNALDWASRPSEVNHEAMALFENKPVFLFSASPGKRGGIRALEHLHTKMHNLHAAPASHQLAVGSAHEALRETGRLRDEEEHLPALESFLAEL